MPRRKNANRAGDTRKRRANHSGPALLIAIVATRLELNVARRCALHALRRRFRTRYEGARRAHCRRPRCLHAAIVEVLGLEGRPFQLRGRAGVYGNGDVHLFLRELPQREPQMTHNEVT
jgi:hypothetical protein